MLAHLRLVPDVPGLNLGPRTGYSDRVSVVLLSLYNQMLGKYVKLGHDRILSGQFKFMINKLSCHSILYNLNPR